MNPLIQWTQAWAQKNSIPFHFFPVTTSTQDESKKLNLPLSKLHMVLAQKQTKGRGQENRQWIDSDLMSSWTWKTSCTVDPTLSIQIGKFLCQKFQHIWPHPTWFFKEPNDIKLNDKKIAGLLIEVLPVQNHFQIILGLGINVLSAPSLPLADCIASYHSIHQKQWNVFLSDFYQHIKTKVNDNSSPI